METTGRPERPSGLRRALFRLPVRLYQLRLGALLGHRFVLIEHRGRRTGARRRAVVEVVTRDPATGSVTVAAGFGPATDWYRNLRAHPAATVTLASRRIPVRAVFLTPPEGAELLATYATRHVRAAGLLLRFMGFRVDGSQADYRAAGREIPFVRFEPTR